MLRRVTALIQQVMDGVTPIQPVGLVRLVRTTSTGKDSSVTHIQHQLASQVRKPAKSLAWRIKAVLRLPFVKAPVQTLTALQFGANGN